MLEKDNISTKIKEALAGFCKIQLSNIKGSSLLREELGLDSMDTIDLVFQLEDNFNIRISDDDMVEFKTFNDVVQFVEKRIGENYEGES